MWKGCLVTLFATEFVLLPPLLFNSAISPAVFLLGASVSTSSVAIGLANVFPVNRQKYTGFLISFLWANPWHIMLILPPSFCAVPLWFAMVLITLSRPIFHRSTRIFLEDCELLLSALIPLALLSIQVKLYWCALADVPVFPFVAGVAMPLVCLKCVTLCFMWKSEMMLLRCGSIGFLASLFIATTVTSDIVSTWRIISPTKTDRMAIVCILCYAAVLASCILCHLFYHNHFSSSNRLSVRSPWFLRGVRIVKNATGTTNTAVTAAEDALIPHDNTICTICLAEIIPGEEVRPLPKCSHLFHATCLENWAQTKMADMLCPTCRGPGLTRFPSSFEGAKSIVDLELRGGEINVNEETERLSSSLGVTPIYGRECMLIGGDIEGAAALVLEHPVIIHNSPASSSKCKVPHEWAEQLQCLNPFLQRDGMCANLQNQVHKLVTAGKIPSKWLLKKWPDVSSTQKRFIVRTILEDVAERLWD